MRIILDKNQTPDSRSDSPANDNERHSVNPEPDTITPPSKLIETDVKSNTALQEAQPKKNKAAIVTAIILLAVLICGGIALSLFLSSKNPSTHNSSSSISNANTANTAADKEKTPGVILSSAKVDSTGSLSVTIYLTNANNSSWSGQIVCQSMQGDQIVEDTEGSKLDIKDLLSGEKINRIFMNVDNVNVHEGITGVKISTENGTVIFQEKDSSIIQAAIQNYTTLADEGKIQELRDTVNQAETLIPQDYTAASYAAVQNPLEDARNILNSEKKRAGEVETAIKDLRSVMDKLVKITPIIINGAGDSVIDIPAGYEGSLIRIHHGGEHNFSVWSCDDAMGHDDLLVNTIGVYDGTVTTILGDAIDKHLEVKADGEWEFAFLPLEAIQMLENGQEMFGDNVLGIPHSSDKSKLEIKNVGGGNFVIHAITEDGKVALVANEIGDYTGTVPNRKYMTFIVESEGAWSVSW